MRYLTLAEALATAEAVTGTDAATLARVSRLDLLDQLDHDAVETMLAIAAGDLDEAAVKVWLIDRIDRRAD